MNNEFFSEIRKLGHDDDMRSRLLMHGIRRILEEKQEQPKLRRMFRRKKPKVMPKGWDE